MIRLDGVFNIVSRDPSFVFFKTGGASRATYFVGVLHESEFGEGAMPGTLVFDGRRLIMVKGDEAVSLVEMDREDFAFFLSRVLANEGPFPARIGHDIEDDNDGPERAECSD